MAKSLVDDPDAVRVIEIRGANATILKLRVAPNDKGWVIGRKGRVANAMRSLLRAANGGRNSRHVILEIV